MGYASAANGIGTVMSALNATESCMANAYCPRIVVDKVSNIAGAMMNEMNAVPTHVNPDENNDDTAAYFQYMSDITDKAGNAGML
jgi:hypothetical protein